MLRLRWITVTVLLVAAEWAVVAPNEIISQEPMVIVSDHKSHFIDAVGRPLPRPSGPAPLASPVNLLNPDKYEFYTFDLKGDLVKRLMTMEEIQSIVANGDNDGGMLIPNTQSKEAEADIDTILESIQGVLSKEIEKNNANETNSHFLDTPDVSSNWNLILPAIFGNTGEQIVPQSKPPSMAMVSDSDLMPETTTRKATTIRIEESTTTRPPTTVQTTTKAPTTPARLRTTAAPITAKPTRVVYPSKAKKPVPIYTNRPVYQNLELKNNFPMQFDPAFTTSTTRPLTTSTTTARSTWKPHRTTQAAAAVKIASSSSSIKFKPTSTSAVFSTKLPVRPSTLLVTETTAPSTTTSTTPRPTTTTTERTTTTTTTTTPKPTTTSTTTTTEAPTTTTTKAPITTTTTTTEAPTTTKATTTTTTTTTTTEAPTTTTTTTTRAPPTTTTSELPILLSAEVAYDHEQEEESSVDDPLSQIIQTLNESPSPPEASQRPQPIVPVQPTTQEVESATQAYKPEFIMIPVNIQDSDILHKLAQNLAHEPQKTKTPIATQTAPNVDSKPNKTFNNNEFYVDEEEPEVKENPTTTQVPPTKLRTTPYPIYNRPNGIVQKVEEYIESQGTQLKAIVAIDASAMPIMSDKMNELAAVSALELKKEPAYIPRTTTVEPEEELAVAETMTDGYSLLEESLSGILNQVSDSRPHSVPLVEDHRIESKVKDIENSEELTLDEELDKLEGINEAEDDDDEDSDEENEEAAIATTTEKEMEKVDLISKNDLPPLEELTETPQEDKFEALESLSMIVGALNDNQGSQNDLKEEAKPIIEPTSELPPTTTPQKVSFETSIVKETHSVSVHQDKPVKVVEEVSKNDLEEDRVAIDDENNSEEGITNDRNAEEEISQETVPVTEEVLTEDDNVGDVAEADELDKEINTEVPVIVQNTPEIEKILSESATPALPEITTTPETSTANLSIIDDDAAEEDEEKEDEHMDQLDDVNSLKTTTEAYLETTTPQVEEDYQEQDTTTTESASEEDLPQELKVENLTLESELQPVTVSAPTTAEPQSEVTTLVPEDAENEETSSVKVMDNKVLPEALRKSDLEEENNTPTTTDTVPSGTTKSEELYEKLGETTTAEPETEVTTELAPKTTVASKTTTGVPESTTTSEEIITKAETKFSPTKVRFQVPTTGYRPSGFKRPGAPGNVFHVKNKPAIRIENRNPTRTPPPVRLQSAPKDALGLEQSTVNLDPDFQDFAKLCNDLAFSYWNTLKMDAINTGRSVILSPFGITSMLSMVFLGARGATSGEMNEILKLDDMITFNPHLVFRNVTDSIENLRENGVYTSALVRELFSDRAKGKLLPFYKEKAQQYYAGYVEEANFNLINDIVRRRTNLLIKRHTWGKIMEYLRTNTIVLKGPLAAVTATVFQTDCSKASVADRDGEMFFAMEPTANQRKLVPVPSVVIKSGFTAGYDPELDTTIVALGNGNNVVSTLLMMPGQQGTTAAADNLERLEEAFMAKPMENWHRLLTTLMERQDLDLQIPKFTHRSFINGTTLMQRMGLKELFDSSKSDLRGLTANANQDMYLADLLQINTFSTCGEDKIPDSHYKEVYPSPPSQKQLSYGRFRKLSKKMHNPYLSTLPENILSRMNLSPDQIGEANEETGKYIEYQRALFDPFYDNKYMEMPLPLRPRQARIPDSPRLKFDKPFLYFVRHNPTGMLLYMGRFNPKLN